MSAGEGRENLVVESYGEIALNVFIYGGGAFANTIVDPSALNADTVAAPDGGSSSRGIRAKVSSLRFL